MVRRPGAGRGQWAAGRRRGPMGDAAGGAGPAPRFPSSAARERREWRGRGSRAGRSRPPLPPALGPAPLPAPKEPAAAASRLWHGPERSLAPSYICVCLFKWTRPGSPRRPGALQTRRAPLLGKDSLPHWWYSRTARMQSCAMCSTMTRLKEGCWTARPTVVPSNVTHSVIQVWQRIWATPQKIIYFVWPRLPVVAEWAGALLGARLTGHQCRNPHHSGKAICSQLKEIAFASLALKLIQSKWGTSSLYIVQLDITGQGQWNPPYVQHQVWNVSVSLLPELCDVCFFSHWSEPWHSQGNNIFSVCSRARWEYRGRIWPDRLQARRSGKV